MLHSSRHKKPLANHNQQQFIQMIKGYAKDNKGKHTKISYNKPKGKQNKKIRKQSRDIFYDESIKYRQSQQEDYFKNIDKKDETNLAFPLEQSFGRVLVNTQDNTKKPQSNDKRSSANGKGSDSRKFQVQNYNKPSKSHFQDAIKKIFKDLDIFNRGRISQTNINKWIPQSALYFLGGIFQKIKLERLSLAQNEFVKLCLPLYDQSNIEDIGMFIQEVLGKESKLNISIQFEQQQKINQNSPVIKRINIFSHSSKQNKLNEQKIFNTNKKINWFASGLDNNASYNERNPIQVQNMKVVSGKKQRQMIHRQSVDMNKEKVRQFNYSPLLGHTNNDYQMQAYPNNQIEVTSFTSNITKRSPVRNVLSVIQKYSHLQKAQIANLSKKRQMNINASKQAKKQYQSKQPTNFTFQLDPNEPYLSNGIIKHQQKVNVPQQRPKINPYHQNKQFHDQKPFAQLYVKTPPRPMTARIIQQKIPKNPHQSRKSSINSQDTQKIDRLSNKLEEYIRFNKEKIERNRQFIRQNSTTHR